MYLAYLGVTIPLLKRASRAGPEPPGCQGRAVRARRLGKPANIIAHHLRRGDGHQPRVAARRALHRRHLQVGPDRRHDRSCSESGSSTTTRYSGTRAGCSRSTAPRSRRATDLLGVDGRAPARPPATLMEDPCGVLARRDAKAIRGGMLLRHRPRARRTRAPCRTDRRWYRHGRGPRSSRSTLRPSRGSPARAGWPSGASCSPPASLAGIPVALGAYAVVRRRGVPSSRSRPRPRCSPRSCSA